ncbi:MAG: branched-chain amino acid ABC transporter ATP-binding protein/permease [Salinisphaera sp.]|jgi:ABC-type branched-subunit amino acid transport system ATPase component/ABC-type branched-subunit amino acid transport system permease subunit|nr:branched-chain amino acid ABC transporter ATP-binding protein/permease [Salinisphaera sp.]
MIKQFLKFSPLMLFFAVVPFFLPEGRAGSYYLTLMILSGAYAIAALGMTVLLGYAGQVSLAQAAFFGIGSYAFSILAVKYGQDFWLSLFGAVVIALIFGALIGLLVLRLRTHYLALVTIGFQIITNLVLNNWDFTGGSDGISGIPRPSLFGIDFMSDQNFYWLTLVFITLAAFVVYRLRYSLLGSTLLALREDEIAASTSGISVVAAKILAFSVCAGLAGLGGAFYASGSMYISPNVYTFSQSVTIFAMVLIGGQESIVGTILGAALLIFLPEMLRFLHDYYIAVYGLAVVVIILFMPKGVYGSLASGAEWGWQKLFAQRQTEIPTASTVQQAPPEKAAVRSDEVILKISDLHKYFGGVKAVQGVDITIRRGDVVVLIGPNGSGKTTVLNTMSGIYKATRGEISFCGHDIVNKSAHQISRLGMSRTFQNIRLFAELSVIENVAIGFYPKATVGVVGTLLLRPKGLREDRQAEEKAKQTLLLLGLDRFHEKAKNLSYGEQRIVEIARAIISDPEILLLDEPVAGMNREEKIRLSGILRTISGMGITILLIEHDMSFVSEVSTYLYVMDYGRLISEGVAREVLKDPAVIQAYLGGEIEDA